jgi:phosphoribosylformylglycinamidine synthase subunit PurL
MTTLAFKYEDDAILLLGGQGSHLGQSTYLRDVLNREEGAPPPVDLTKELIAGNFVRNLINLSQVSAVHDISDGGMALAVIEMALAGNLGAHIATSDHEQLFGEDQARYILTCPTKQAAKIITQAHVAGIDVVKIGITTQDPTIVFGETTIPLATLRKTHEAWFSNYMAG